MEMPKKITFKKWSKADDVAEVKFFDFLSQRKLGIKVWKIYHWGTSDDLGI